jgi:hypothetical protein
MPTKKTTNNAFFKMAQAPLNPSPQLAEVLGSAAPISRPQVAKKVWAYIKKHKLQDPKKRRRFGPQITQQRVALLGQFPQPLSLTAGVFTRDHSDVAGYVLALGKAARIPQEHLRRQGRHWSGAGMGQQAQRLGPLLDLFFDLPVQFLDPLLQLHV